MSKSKHLVGLILAATLMATLIPFSAIVYAQRSEEKRAEKFVELADRAREKVGNFIDLINATAMDTIRANETLYGNWNDTVLLFKWGEGNLSAAYTALEPEPDYPAAIANATQAMSIFREVFKALNTILTEAGVERGELIDAQGLIEAMKRALDRIERIREIVGVAFEKTGDATAEWTTADAYRAPYSALLSVPLSPAGEDTASIILPTGTMPFVELEHFSFWLKQIAGGEDFAETPYHVILLDVNGPKTIDGIEGVHYVALVSYSLDIPVEEIHTDWTEYTELGGIFGFSDQVWNIHCSDAEMNYIDSIWTIGWSDAHEKLDFDGDTVVTVIKVQLAWTEHGPASAYVDYVTVNGIVVFNEPGVFSILAILDSAEEYLDIETAIEWLSEGKVHQTAWNLTQANQLISLAHSSLKKKTGELNVKRIESYLKLIGNLYKKVEKAVNRLPAADDYKAKLKTVETLIEGAEEAFTAENYSDAIAKLVAARNVLKEIERAIVESRKGGK